MNPDAFTEIVLELKCKALEVNRYRTKAGDGRSQSFGVVNRRSLPPDYSRWCWRRPRLFQLLLEFAEKYVDIPWNAITLNQNYQAAPHYDKNNRGQSFLVAFGDFTGGELEIHEGDRKGLHNICYNPIRDDFSKVLHSVKPFEGERYSLVFYTFDHPKWTVQLPPPSVREVNGKLIFFRGEEAITEGLPHPLRKKLIAATPEPSAPK